MEASKLGIPQFMLMIHIVIKSYLLIGIPEFSKRNSHRKSSICHCIGLRDTGGKIAKTGKASIRKWLFLGISMKILPKKWRKLGIDLKKFARKGQNLSRNPKILSRTFRKRPILGQSRTHFGRFS